MFQANSPAQATIGITPFTLTNDDIALEKNEQYQISLTDSSITNSVLLGAATTITIVDDDGLSIIHYRDRVCLNTYNYLPLG